MYTEEPRATSSAGNGAIASAGSQGDMVSNSESGPALEVIELANGETIW